MNFFKLFVLSEKLPHLVRMQIAVIFCCYCSFGIIVIIELLFFFTYLFLPLLINQRGIWRTAI